MGGPVRNYRRYRPGSCVVQMAAGFDPCLEAAEAKNVLAPPSWSPRLPPGESRTPRAAGAQGIFAEKVSGKSTNGRHELDKAIKALGPGDTLMWSGWTGS